MPTIDVYGVAHGLEGEEGNTHGQQDFLPDEIGTHQIVELEREVIVYGDLYARDLREEIGKKVGVLEIDQNEQVDHHTQRQPRLLFPRNVCLVDAVANEVISQCRDEQNDEVEAAGFVIKKQADGKEVGVSTGGGFVEKTVEDENNSQKNPEVELGEQQRIFAGVG